MLGGALANGLKEGSDLANMVQVVGSFKRDEVPDCLAPALRMCSVTFIPRGWPQGAEKSQVGDT